MDSRFCTSCIGDFSRLDYDLVNLATEVAVTVGAAKPYHSTISIPHRSFFRTIVPVDCLLSEKIRKELEKG